MKPYIERVQKVFPGAPHVVNPQTALGITILNNFAGLAANRWVKWVGGMVGSIVPSGWLPEIGGSDWTPPDYPSLDVE